MVSLLRQVNWQSFLASTSQDLYPYLAFQLEPFIDCIEAPRELEPLFNARRLTAVHNLRLRHELGRAVETLRQSGIPALALKGVVLAYTAYPDPSLRPMSDLDLLVPTGTREKALHVLQKVGFGCSDSALELHRDHCWRLAPEQEFAPPLQLGPYNVLLEVHSQLECSEPTLPIPAEEFWSRSASVDLNGLKARTLCPEDFLFHLCLHQSRWHRFEKGLLPLVDLRVFLASHPDLNWADIAARSVQCRCATWMYLTLEAALNLVGASVPDIFFQALPRPSGFPRLRCLAEEQIWSAQAATPGPGLIPTLLAEPSWKRRAHMFFVRMRLVGKDELGPKPPFARLFQRVWLSNQRLIATLKTKIPRYFRAWKSGQLKVDVLRRAARLLRHSNTLFQLAEQETGCADDDGRVGQK